MAWFIWLLVGVALQILAYLLMPGTKQPKPPAAQDLEGPVAEAGKPIPVIFGTVQIKGLNNLGYMEADTWTRSVKV